MNQPLIKNTLLHFLEWRANKGYYLISDEVLIQLYFEENPIPNFTEFPELLKRFMKEFFPYGEFKRAKIFTKEMRNDYYWQAYVICRYLGLNIIYEYGKDEIRCHVTYVEGKRPPNTPFVEVYPSIYD